MMDLEVLLYSFLSWNNRRVKFLRSIQRQSLNLPHTTRHYIYITVTVHNL